MNAYFKDSVEPAQACFIWMHGLGADAQNMMLVADELRLQTAVRHVFLNAPIRPVTMNNHLPMRAWYDILGLTDRAQEDRAGIVASQQLVQQTIAEQVQAGFRSQQIFLAGFSQGGAMALYSGLHHPQTLGGIICLSAYLPLAAEYTTPNHFDMPIFMGCGIYDPVVLPAWTKKSYDGLLAHGLRNVAWHEYPMDHSICPHELRDIEIWFNHSFNL